ncbi:SGNH/GDSL hydrolase family protein [Brevibacterium sp. FAM 24638]|uniref:SGNH/GDSL hydrolase family protein n=1 Tax=Brevibacterium sp. FAM 24638 TaxID=3415681 RepID=UPI003C7D4633
MMSTAVLDKLVRFQRLENSLPFAQSLDARTLAGVFGGDETQYTLVVEDLDRQRKEVAARLATSPVIGSHLQNLPFSEGAHLVAIGESTTADRLSWFEILRTLVESHRPDLRLRFTNLAVSGATTTQALSMLPSIRRHEPDWLFCMLGSNDCQRFDAPSGPLLVSPEVTKRNLTELRARALTKGEAEWVWLTPTRVDEERIARFPFFAGSGISWTNHDLNEMARKLPTGTDMVIDGSAASSADAPGALADDGLHPSAQMQGALAAEVVESLVEEGR